MAVTVEIERLLAAKFEVLLPHLDERQRRLVMGAEARVLGHGGIRAVARAAGVAENTVSRGVSDLEAGEPPLGRTRRPGGGRKRLSDVDAGLLPALLALVEPDERGDPMSPLRWTTKSTRALAAQLTAQGHRVGADTVADLLRQEGFSLQANAKTIEGRQHPDRDAQFRYINDQVKDHQGTADPVDQCGHQEEGASRSVRQRRPAVAAEGRADSRRSPTTSPATVWARPCRTGSTTWPPTPAGSTSAPITTPPRSRSSRSAAGGPRPGAATTPTPGGC